MSDYNLKYRTLDQLMASVETDLSTFADQGLINRGSVIKVVRRVNEDLGLKINRLAETVIHIKDHKSDLPIDFYKLDSAYICGKPLYAHAPSEIFGTVTIEHEEVIPCKSTVHNACINSCGGQFWVTQLYKEKIVRYGELAPVRVTQRSRKSCTDNCGNINLDHCEYEIDLEEGQLVTGLREGNLYMCYMADMSDEAGNLTILDHPLVQDYYEYAVKKHLLETWMLNNDADVAQKLGYIKNELNEARRRALLFVNTVEYSQIQKVFEENRKRFYARYVRSIEKPITTWTPINPGGRW